MSVFEVVNSNVETAVIPKGTVVNGNIEITGRLEMHGEVNGNINSTHRVDVSGEVIGNISANDIYTRDSFIEGKINCKHGAVISENTVVLGDIEADSLMVDGAIQGKIDVKGVVTVGDKAIIDSDIKAKSIQVSHGAAINGTCSLCYSDVDVKSVFPEEEIVEKASTTVNKAKSRKNAS